MKEKTIIMEYYLIYPWQGMKQDNRRFFISWGVHSAQTSTNKSANDYAQKISWCHLKPIETMFSYSHNL